jgi:hypothetical protein
MNNFKKWLIRVVDVKISVGNILLKDKILLPKNTFEDEVYINSFIEERMMPKLRSKIIKERMI